mmetsp:Transcript_8249/g.18490  ORF Transcript_8249/g.18490 Transcript_8249/m.18490 type:complete len:235 (-) Transcript_8249:1377-2081(-)
MHIVPNLSAIVFMTPWRSLGHEWHAALGVSKSGLCRTVSNTLVLYFEPLVSNLESIHLFNGKFSSHDRVVRDKAKSFRFAGVTVNVHFGTNNMPKWIKGSGKISIRKINGKMVDEKIGTSRSLTRPGRDWRRGSTSSSYFSRSTPSSTERRIRRTSSSLSISTVHVLLMIRSRMHWMMTRRTRMVGRHGRFMPMRVSLMMSWRRHTHQRRRVHSRSHHRSWWSAIMSMLRVFIR